MSMTTRQKEILNAFSLQQSHDWIKEQENGLLAPFMLGDMLANGSAAELAVQDKYATVAFKLPAPAGGAATTDFIAFKAPAGGTIVSVELVPNAAWTAGNAAGDTYLASVRRYNNTPADLTFAHDLVAGVGAGASALLPSGANSALLTSGDDITLTVSTTNLTITNETAWVTTPVVGDFLSITSAATNARGATPSNPGVYRITAVTALTLTATKLFGTNPEAVTVVAAAAGDVAGVRLISQIENSFASGDVLGVRVIVPISTSTPVDVSALFLSAIVRYRLA